MENLFGKTLGEINSIIDNLELPAYTANQITDWLYKKKILSFGQMTNLSKKSKERLSEKFELRFSPHTKVDTSIDGTKKYLFPALADRFIEAAYIPEKTRSTLCISSQVGCKMGCLFCMTGKQGFQANLGVDEILNQVQLLPEREMLSNIVYMGMGEPMDNISNVLKSTEILTADYGYGWSPKRITVSTIGIIPAMQQFLDKSRCHIAISLHTPFEDERRNLMPVQNVYPIQEVISMLKKYDFTGQRRVSIEYIMFSGLNDTLRHVNELSRLLNGIKCRINLIRFHSIPDSPLKGSDEASIKVFLDRLNKKGITTTLRASRGQDIGAACGLLSTKEMIKKNTLINEDF
jgi:23S rRNA (adenine2503-C2)-methyltransferase